jgi:pyroglutamyl-peptidase
VTTILITGFGPFPGAPFNPTEPLVEALARRRHPSFADVRRATHVFRVSYEAIDKELPALIEREAPDALVMFGLAARSKHVRIETRARNVLSRALPDVNGRIACTSAIVPGGPATLPLRAPAHRLLAAVRQARVPAALSRNAGSYLCNYLCWRAAVATAAGGPRVVTFIHVPDIDRARLARPDTLSLDHLIRAGVAIMRTALAAARAIPLDQAGRAADSKKPAAVA